MHWPEDEETIDSIRKDWREPHGDRRQELVFIGQDLPRERMLSALEDSLLTDDEMLLGAEDWKKRLSDPFPNWITQTVAEEPTP